jgi:hypothetical protein
LALKFLLKRRLDREKVAEELVSARLHRADRFGMLTARFARELVTGMEEIAHKLMVELYLTHYSNKQLRSLLDFYRSQTGQSIIETDRTIDEEFRREIPRRLKPFLKRMETEQSREQSSRNGLLRSWPDPLAED